MRIAAYGTRGWWRLTRCCCGPVARLLRVCTSLGNAGWGLARRALLMFDCTQQATASKGHCICLGVEVVYTLTRLA